MITIFKDNKDKVFQFIKLALISGLVFVMIVIIFLSLLAWFYRDAIKQRFVTQINQGLQTEVFIEDISINVFRSFPLVSISLRNVTMLETPEVEQRDTLLSAQRVYFQFSIIDFLRKNYSVEQAEVVDGFMHMKYFDDATNNYTFWKSTPADQQGDEELEFQLQRVVMTNMQYKYTDYPSGHFLSFAVQNAIVGGDFLHDDFLMDIRGNMMVNEIIIDEAFLLGEQEMAFNLKADVLNGNVITFREGVFNLGSHAFTAQGSIDLSESDTYIDILINAKQLNLGDVIADLPPRFANYFKGYKSTGELYFNAAIKGTFGQVVKPYVSADFGISQGELYDRKADLRFSNISFQASFNNGSYRHLSSSTLTVSDFNAKVNKGDLSGRVTVFNFLEPALDVKIYSTINAEEWQRFLQIEQVSNATGELLIDMEFKGKLDKNKKLTVYNFMASQVTGGINGKNVSFSLTNDPLKYHSINGDFLFNNNDLVIRQFDGKASTSDFAMKGYFRNVLPWLFFDDERLFVSASLVSDNLNFNELLQYSVNESDTTYKLRLSEMIDFRFHADIGKLAFRKFYGEKVKGNLSMREQVFYANNFSFSTMKGNVKASGYINGKNKDLLLIGCEAHLDKVDVHDLFYQMGNFGQQGIEAVHLRGLITADARFISQWSPFLDIDWNSLDVTADVKIENGELINYKPMLALSRFIRVGDLNQVKFSTLENQIRIKNQKLIIPDMTIESNAINIELSGEHTFENAIDYRLQVLLSDLLARKNRQNRNPQEQYGDIIDDGLGQTTLFLRVIGTIDEPVFRYDTRGVREKLTEDFKKEGQTLRQVFRAEFGLGRNDTLPDGSSPVGSAREIEQKEIEKREEGKFIIEWDD